jgi:hypothetical protein
VIWSPDSVILQGNQVEYTTYVREHNDEVEFKLHQPPAEFMPSQFRGNNGSSVIIVQTYFQHCTKLRAMSIANTNHLSRGFLTPEMNLALHDCISWLREAYFHQYGDFELCNNGGLLQHTGEFLDIATRGVSVRDIAL